MERDRSDNLETVWRLQIADLDLNVGQDLIFKSVLDFVLQDNNRLEEMLNCNGNILGIALSQMLRGGGVKMLLVL